MASTKKDTHITNLAALEKAANGEIVTLPGWTVEQPFVARLKRASLTGMIRAGKIPNPLIAAAQKLYEGSGKSRANATFEETAKVMRLVVEEALAEPTMEQLKAAGLDLTEEQADQIYLYAIKGAKVLEAFESTATPTLLQSTEYDQALLSLNFDLSSYQSVENLLQESYVFYPIFQDQTYYATNPNTRGITISPNQTVDFTDARKR